MNARARTAATASVHHIALRISRAPARLVAPFLTDARLYLDAAVSALALTLDPRKMRICTKMPISTNAIASALIDFAADPTADNAAVSYRVINSHHAATLKRSDSGAAKLISETVSAPEPNAPLVHVAPCGALDWQTSPSISTSPDHRAASADSAHHAILRNRSRAERLDASADKDKSLDAARNKRHEATRLRAAASGIGAALREYQGSGVTSARYDRRVDLAGVYAPAPRLQNRV